MDDTASGTRGLVLYSDEVNSSLKSTLPPAALGWLFVDPNTNCTASALHGLDAAYFKVLIFLAANQYPHLGWELWRQDDVHLPHWLVWSNYRWARPYDCVLAATWGTLTLLVRSITQRFWSSPPFTTRLRAEALPSRHGRALHAMVGRHSPMSWLGKPSGQMDVFSACVRFAGESDGPKDLSITFPSNRAILQVTYTTLHFLEQYW